MCRPPVDAMTKQQVLNLLGTPDAEDTQGNQTTFVYLMPTFSSKGVFNIEFRNNRVIDTRYDDSGEQYYPEQR